MLSILLDLYQFCQFETMLGKLVHFSFLSIDLNQFLLILINSWSNVFDFRWYCSSILCWFLPGFVIYRLSLVNFRPLLSIPVRIVVGFFLFVDFCLEFADCSWVFSISLIFVVFDLILGLNYLYWFSIFSPISPIKVVFLSTFVDIFWLLLILCRLFSISDYVIYVTFWQHDVKSCKLRQLRHYCVTLCLLMGFSSPLLQSCRQGLTSYVKYRRLYTKRWAAITILLVTARVICTIKYTFLIFKFGLHYQGIL